MTTPLDFETLVARHQGAVCAIAYAVLRDRARSEEVAQEAFLVAWQKLPGMVPAPSLPGWVCGIARNLARNAARRRLGQRPLGLRAERRLFVTAPLRELGRAWLGLFLIRCHHRYLAQRQSGRKEV